jgi:RNAse (barnase) inhibitor barstar
VLKHWEITQSQVSDKLRDKLWDSVTGDILLSLDWEHLKDFHHLIKNHVR